MLSSQGYIMDWDYIGQLYMSSCQGIRQAETKAVSFSAKERATVLFIELYSFMYQNKMFNDI